VGAFRAGEGRTAVLASAGPFYLATEDLRQQLRAVTDTKDRDARFEDRRIDRRRPIGVNRFGTAGKDYPARLALEELGNRCVVSHYLGVDARFTDAPCDQLGVLRPEVDD
jgi:hypothetical protein